MKGFDNMTELDLSPAGIRLAVDRFEYDIVLKAGRRLIRQGNYLAAYQAAEMANHAELARHVALSSSDPIVAYRAAKISGNSGALARAMKILDIALFHSKHLHETPEMTEARYAALERMYPDVTSD